MWPDAQAPGTGEDEAKLLDFVIPPHLIAAFGMAVMSGWRFRKHRHVPGYVSAAPDEDLLALITRKDLGKRYHETLCGALQRAVPEMKLPDHPGEDIPIGPPPPPYPFCRTPEKCAGKGYCPADIACND